MAGADELRLATGALRALALVAVPTCLVAALVAGPAGAFSAMLGLLFVLVLFGSSALLLARVARRSAAGSSDPMSLAPLVLGPLFRIPLYLVALNALSALSWVHGRSLAAATALAVAVTLAHELRLLARTPRLFWIDADTRTTSIVPHATRSESL